MNQRGIEVIVKPDGTLKIEAVGFEGADCEKATAFLEDALGVTGKQTRKADYYKTTATVKKHQKAGI